MIDKCIYYSANLIEIIKLIYREKLDIIYSLRHTSIMLNLAILFSRARLKIGLKGNISSLVFDGIKYYRRDIYRAVAFNSIFNEPEPINSYFNQYSPDSKIVNIKKKKIFILPGGGDNFKKWDIKNYIKLCEKLGDSFFYIFVLGESEKEYIDFITDFLKRFDGEILYSTNLYSLISYFLVGDLFITNDCGPSHIARMMFKPMITLFSDIYGDADRVIKEWFLPYSGAICIKSEKYKDINSISVEEVYLKARDLLPA